MIVELNSSRSLVSSDSSAASESETEVIVGEEIAGIGWTSNLMGLKPGRAIRKVQI
jgi:hypothetical protein